MVRPIIVRLWLECWSASFCQGYCGRLGLRWDQDDDVVCICLKVKAPEKIAVGRRQPQRRALAMRRLTLHASALNDEEYDLYTSSIIDLALCDSNKTDTRDDTFYEEIRVGVREVRAWLRGRYPDIQVNNIDAVCQF